MNKYDFIFVQFATKDRFHYSGSIWSANVTDYGVLFDFLFVWEYIFLEEEDRSVVSITANVGKFPPPIQKDGATLITSFLVFPVDY
jgi:hypothetical protein